MFLSLRRCAEHMSQLHRLKVTGQVYVIYPSIRVRSISPASIERFSLHFTPMFLSVRRCAEHMTQLPRFKVKGFTIEFRIRSISPEEHMTQLPRLKVTGQCHVIYPSIRVHSISPESFERFSLNYSNVPIG